MKGIDDIFYKPLFLTDPKRSLIKAIEKNEKRITLLNKRQLDQGKDANDQSLGKYANFKYKGRFQPVDLKLTGSFRDKFTLQVNETQTEIFSQDVKEKDLKKRYGKDILGIPEYLIPSMAKIIQTDFQAFFKQTYFK